MRTASPKLTRTAAKVLMLIAVRAVRGVARIPTKLLGDMPKDQTALVRSLAKLERAGFIETHERSARQTVVVLTAVGKRESQRLNAAWMGRGAGTQCQPSPTEKGGCMNQCNLPTLPLVVSDETHPTGPVRITRTGRKRVIRRQSSSAQHAVVVQARAIIANEYTSAPPAESKTPDKNSIAQASVCGDQESAPGGPAAHHTTATDAVEPLSRADMVLIGRAVKEGWDVPPERRALIMRQLDAAVNSEKPSIVISASRLLVRIHELTRPVGEDVSSS